MKSSLKLASSASASAVARARNQAKNPNRRKNPRKAIEPLEIKSFTSLDHLTLVSRSGEIIDASSTGFMLRLTRDDLVPKQFKQSLALSELIGDQVMLTVLKMDLELSGKIVRTKRTSKDVFEIAIDFSEDAPEYWRECLLDLLPNVGELTDD